MTLSPETARALVDRAHDWLDAEAGRPKSNARRRFDRAVKRAAIAVADSPERPHVAYLFLWLNAVAVARVEMEAQ